MKEKVRTIGLALLALLWPSAGFSQGDCQSLASPLDQVVCREKEFAGMSLSHGVKAAFLGFLADQAILFRPGPVEGKSWMAGRPDPPVQLTWGPLFAGVSCSGELGYTLGPYELRDRAGQQPPRHGHYFTLWKKEADGPWKVILDYGVSYEKPWGGPASFRGETTDCRSVAPGGDARRNAWEKEEKSICRKLTAEGSERTLAPFLSADTWLLWDGEQPLQGRKPGLDFLRKQDRKARVVRCEPLGAGSSAAGDLGFSYGSLQDSLGRQGYYLRLWRSSGRGNPRLSAAVTVLSPPPPPAKPD